MGTVDAEETTLSVCANCGKEGSDVTNTCNKCKSVMYCNAACKKKHRHKHKKDCEEHVRLAAELHDKELFKEPPPAEECPICMLLLPINSSQKLFKSCCGKTICHGCAYAMVESEGGGDLCPYCRAPKQSSDEEHIKRIKELMDKDNGEAFNMLAQHYYMGTAGVPQDDIKANELYLRAGELGCAAAFYNLGVAYNDGLGVEGDMKKAKHYYELAAMNGDAHARHNLGELELEGLSGNHQRSLRHFIMAAKAGYKESLDQVKRGFKKGLVTKDEYASTLRAHHERLDEMKSDEREEAAQILAEMRRSGFRP